MHINDPGNQVAITLPRKEGSLGTNFVLATSVISLIRGDNIFGLQLCMNTINLYLKTVATLITASGNPYLPDAKTNKWTNFIIDKLTPYKAVKNCSEEVKNCCEAFTDDMI
jgi:hypothetical protein